MRIYLLFGIIFTFVTPIFSQGNAKLFEVPKNQDKALAPNNNQLIIQYENVNDRTILWSKIIWERIVLNEKENAILYFPVDTIRTEKRSLYYTLLKALKAGRVNAYTDSYFEETRSFQDLLPAIRKRDTTSVGFQLLNQGKELPEAFISTRDISAYDIKEYRIKGVFYFDKRRSERRYRILGIAPVAYDVNFIDEITEENKEEYLVELFWIWYPEIRPILAATPSFNEVNTNFPMSFDRILNTRLFKPIIYQTDNELDDIASLELDSILPDFNLGNTKRVDSLGIQTKFFKKLFKGKKKEENQTTVLNPTKQQ